MFGTMYRVVETVTTGFSTTTTTQTVLWRGTNLDSLKKQYPIDDLLGVDQLTPYSIHDGYERHDFRFEKYDPIDVWVRCNDPRCPSPESDSEHSTEELIDLYNSGAMIVLGRIGLWS